jgi:hypothetical protein
LEWALSRAAAKLANIGISDNDPQHQPACALSQRLATKDQEFIVEMESKIVVAAPFCPAFTPRQHGNFYEIRTYTMLPGSAPTVVEKWAERIEGRVELSPLAAAGHTELGPLNQ